MKLFTRNIEETQILTNLIINKYSNLKTARESTWKNRIDAAKIVSHRNTGNKNSIWTNDYPYFQYFAKKSNYDSL